MVIWRRGITHGSIQSTYETLTSPIPFVAEVLVFSVARESTPVSLIPGIFCQISLIIRDPRGASQRRISPTTGKRLLSSATVDEIFRNQLPDTPNFARHYVPAAEPELVYPSDGYYGRAPLEMPQGWGLSFMISPSVTGRSDSTAHWSGMSNMFWWCDRERGVAGIVASQILPFPDPGLVSSGLWWKLLSMRRMVSYNEGGHWGLNLKGIDRES